MELTYMPQLQDIISATGRNTLAAPAAASLWPVLAQAEGTGAVAMAALAYFFHTSTTPQGERVWKDVQIGRDEYGDLRPKAATWKEFCLVHLGKADSTISGYKRVWEVYHTHLGYSLEDLAGVGVFKLKAAVALVDKMDKEGAVDERILRGLFGEPNVCVKCGGWVDEPGEVCPHCDEDFEAVRPMVPDRFANLVQDVRKELYGEDEAKPIEDLDFVGSFEFRREQDEVVELALLADYRPKGGDKVVLPQWAIPVVDDDAPETQFGVRRAHLDAVKKWLATLPGVE